MASAGCAFLSKSLVGSFELPIWRSRHWRGQDAPAKHHLFELNGSDLQTEVRHGTMFLRR
jgi:hypothetical protein